MLRIGLTGGIGSGKSTVARIFKTLGVPVYNADDAAKRLMSTEPELKKAITSEFGASCFKGDTLDTGFIASQVFNNPKKLNWLNSLIHPAIIADAKKWMSKQTGPYALLEAALLFESSANEGLDYVVGISAPEWLRVRRVITRDLSDEEEVRKRILGQWKEADKLAQCDFIISNDETQLLIPQALDLDKKFRELSTQQVPA